MTDVAKHERNEARLERLLSALAGAKDLRPGIVTRRLVDAVVRIPWLTAEWVARPRIAPLAKRIGLTSTMVSQRRARALEKSSREENFAAGFAEERREERLLEDLNALLESASPTPEDVLSLLSGEPPNLPKVLADTRDRQTTRFAKRGADAKHAPYKNKRERLRAIFATGKYSSKMECAENEHEKLEIVYNTGPPAIPRTPGRANPPPRATAVPSARQQAAPLLDRLRLIVPLGFRPQWFVGPGAERHDFAWMKFTRFVLPG